MDPTVQYDDPVAWLQLTGSLTPPPGFLPCPYPCLPHLLLLTPTSNLLPSYDLFCLSFPPCRASAQPFLAPSGIFRGSLQAA